MLGMLVRPLLRRKRRSRKPVGALLSTIATLGLCAFQFGDRNELNKMPFDQVQALVSNLAKARSLAKQGNIDLLVGQVESGKTVSMRGEVTDANCYLGTHTHAYDHALCAKSGSPAPFSPKNSRPPVSKSSASSGATAAIAFRTSRHLRSMTN